MSRVLLDVVAAAAMPRIRNMTTVPDGGNPEALLFFPRKTSGLPLEIYIAGPHIGWHFRSIPMEPAHLSSRKLLTCLNLLHLQSPDRNGLSLGLHCTVLDLERLNAIHCLTAAGDDSNPGTLTSLLRSFGSHTTSNDWTRCVFLFGRSPNIPHVNPCGFEIIE